MKAEFKFDMNEPDDVVAHMRHTKSLDLASALWHMQNEIRKKTKFNGEWEDVSDMFYQTLDEYGIDLDELLQ